MITTHRIASADSLVDPELIGQLKKAMQPSRLRQELERDWLYLPNRNEVLIDVIVERVYPRDRGQRFVLHIRSLVQGKNGPRWVDLWGEIARPDARTRVRSLRERLAKRRRQQIDKAGASDQVDCLPALNMVIRLKGLDERIDGLRLVADDRAAAAELRRHNLTDDALRGARRWRSELLGHRLGRRCVARFRPVGDDTRRPQQNGNTSSIIAKFYRNHSPRGRSVHAVMETLWRSGWDRSSRLRIPEPLAFVDQWNCLLTEDCPAASLHEHTDQAYVAGLPSVAGVISKLHRAPLELAGRTYGPDDEAALLERCVALASRLTSEHAVLAQSTLARLCKQLRNLPEQAPHPCLVHRDFYDKQVLVGGGTMTLLDFDTLCVSDPALDVGNFVGHLYLAGLQGHIDHAAAEAIFIDAYDPRMDSYFADRMRLYTASTLLRVACLHWLWPPRQHLGQRLMDRASALC